MRKRLRLRGPTRPLWGENIVPARATINPRHLCGGSATSFEWLEEPLGGADVVCDAQAAKQKRMAAEQERKERDSARKQAQAERKRRQQQEKEGGGRGRNSGGGRGPGRGRSQRGGRGGADEESEEEEVVDSGPRTAPLTVPELQERFDELDDDGDGTEPTTPCICAF